MSVFFFLQFFFRLVFIIIFITFDSLKKLIIDVFWIKDFQFINTRVTNQKIRNLWIKMKLNTFPEKCLFFSKNFYSFQFFFLLFFFFLKNIENRVKNKRAMTRLAQLYIFFSFRFTNRINPHQQK